MVLLHSERLELLPLHCSALLELFRTEELASPGIWNAAEGSFHRRAQPRVFENPKQGEGLQIMKSTGGASQLIFYSSGC